MGWERHHRSIKCIALIYSFPLLLSYLWQQHIAFYSIVRFDQEECCQWILFCLPTGCSREELHSLVLHWCCRATSWVQEGIRVPGNAWVTASKITFSCLSHYTYLMRFLNFIYNCNEDSSIYFWKWLNAWNVDICLTVQCWLHKFWLLWYVWNHLCAFYLYWVPHTNIHSLSFNERQKLKWYSYENKCLSWPFFSLQKSSGKVGFGSSKWAWAIYHRSCLGWTPCNN